MSPDINNINYGFKNDIENKRNFHPGLLSLGTLAGLGYGYTAKSSTPGVDQFKKEFLTAAKKDKVSNPYKDWIKEQANRLEIILRRNHTEQTQEKVTTVFNTTKEILTKPIDKAVLDSFDPKKFEEISYGDLSDLICRGHLLFNFRDDVSHSQLDEFNKFFKSAAKKGEAGKPFRNWVDEQTSKLGTVLNAEEVKSDYDKFTFIVDETIYSVKERLTKPFDEKFKASFDPAKLTEKAPEVKFPNKFIKPAIGAAIGFVVTGICILIANTIKGKNTAAKPIDINPVADSTLDKQV